jgi:hypothetical protein
MKHLQPADNLLLNLNSSSLTHSLPAHTSHIPYIPHSQSPSPQ